MILNISGISASNVLKMFLNIIVSIGRTFINFHPHKPSQTSWKHRYQLFACRYTTLVGKKKYSNKKKMI